MAILNLVVLRSTQPEVLADFYAHLGIQFRKHRHGGGPEHFAAELGACVFEIYPGGGAEPAMGRLGFEVENLDELMARLVAAGVTVASPARRSEWGYRAVAADLEGMKVELVEKAGGDGI